MTPPIQLGRYSTPAAAAYQPARRLRKYTAEQIKFALSLVDMGLSIGQAARATGMSEHAVGAHCRRAGIESAHQFANSRTFTDEVTSLMVEASNSGHGITAIARHKDIQSSFATVRRVLWANGCKTRPRGWKYAQLHAPRSLDAIFPSAVDTVPVSELLRIRK